MDDFDADAVQSIVRRAVELDSDRLDSHHGDRAGIDPQSLVLAATEIGIDRSAIETAIAEYRIGSAPRTARLDRIFGPQHPSASRRVAARSDRVEVAIADWLTKVQFRPVRRDRHDSVWDRRTDLAARTQRVAASVVGGDLFRRTGRIRVRVVPVDETSTLVQASGDRTAARASSLALSLGFVAAGATAVIAGIIAIPALAVNALPCAAAAAGITVLHRRRTERTATDLERLLDRLVADERPRLLGTARTTARRADYGGPLPAPGSTA